MSEPSFNFSRALGKSFRDEFIFGNLIVSSKSETLFDLVEDDDPFFKYSRLKESIGSSFSEVYPRFYDLCFLILLCSRA